jgi:hypothetical protein
MAQPINSREEVHEITIAMSHAEVSEKADIKHIEEGVEAGDVIIKSPFEDLPWKKTWVVFHKVALVCLFAAFSAAAE